MIVAEPKPIEEVAGFIRDRRHVLIVGCGECVTVCQVGGEKEVEVLASALRILWKKDGHEGTIDTQTIVRQCEPEYVEQLAKKIRDADCVLSLGCGVGVQFIAEAYPDKWVVPGLNTSFGGGTVKAGIWEERCGFCGECVLHLTGGICPIIRCSKSILNGPCGGSQDGHCEIGQDIPCAWQLIYDRLKGLGRLDLLDAVQPPKNWKTARDGGPRKFVKEEAIIE
ncbi:MAG: methylenetetrahydrofolate reductase C-terminal domain-containing protein [Bacillota bacterium]|jgi:ferredoxin